MTYSDKEYREARKQWLDLAEKEAKIRGLEFRRDSFQEAFQIPEDRAVRVRASLTQDPRIELTLGDELKAIAGDYGDIGDRILLVVLQIHQRDRFDPNVDSFIPIRDSLLMNDDFVSKHNSGDLQLNMNTEKRPFNSRKNKWKWVFEK